MSPTRTRETWDDKKNENASSGPRGSTADRQERQTHTHGCSHGQIHKERFFLSTSVGLTRLQRKEEYLAGGARQLATTRELVGKPMSYGT